MQLTSMNFLMLKNTKDTSSALPPWKAETTERSGATSTPSIGKTTKVKTLVLHYHTIKSFFYQIYYFLSGYDTIVSFLHALASNDPYVNVFSIGQTTEGRDMNVIGITRAGKGRPNVYIEAGEEEELIKTKYWF